MLVLLVPLGAGDHGDHPSTMTEFQFGRELYGPGDLVTGRMLVEDEEGILELHATISNGAQSVRAACDRRTPFEEPLSVDAICRWTLPSDASGIFNVTSFEVKDNSTYLTEYKEGEHYNASSALQISMRVRPDNPDTEPPVLQSILLNKRVAGQGGTVRVEVLVDDRSPLAGVDIHWDAPDGVRKTTCAGKDNRAECVYVVDEKHPFGDVTVARIRLTDGAGNSIELFRGSDFVSDANHQLSFEVSSGVADVGAPVLRAYEVEHGPVRVGDLARVRVEANDTVVASALVALQGVFGGQTITLTACGLPDGPVVDTTCSGRVPDVPLGPYHLQLITLRDDSGNEKAYPIEARTPAAQAATRITVIGPVLRTTGESGEALVGSLMPAVPEAAAKHVLPFVVAQGPDGPVEAVRFTFTNGTSSFGSRGCAADAEPLDGAFVCRVLLPPDMPRGLYTLTHVEAKTTDWVTVTHDPEFAPVVRIGASLHVLPQLPDGWIRYWDDGMTKASFNGLEDPRPEPTLPEEPQGPEVHDSPFPLPLVLPLLAWQRLRRLRRAQ